LTGKLLIVDDEKDMLSLLKRVINEKTSHHVTTEGDPVKAIEILKENRFDMVITDLKMPKMNGITFLTEIKKLQPQVPVIMLTAYATIETAVEAIQMGAYDYISKPFQTERILLTIDKVMRWQNMVKENIALREALSEKILPIQMIGSSTIMTKIFERIKQVAPTTATVLITGSSGTGKELVARAIHKNSLRKSQKLITVNCTAIPEPVIESELFGHLKGAFTGAWKDKRGLVEEAHQGTLFLDEIGDLSPLMQTKLLRLLQEGEYKPVGSVITKHSDLRVIAATNHNLGMDIKEKRFREDLYYRLNVIHIELPPLKERKADVPLLCYHFLKKYAHIYQKNIQEISQKAMQALCSKEYPGNVRELENIIERGVVFCRTSVLEFKDLFIDEQENIIPLEVEQDWYELSFRDAKEKILRSFHEQYIRNLLREHKGNISKAAEASGIQRQYLHRLMKETGIEGEIFR